MFEIRKTKRGKYRFRLYAANGQVIAKSKKYATKSGAINGCYSVMKNSQNAGIIYTC